MCFISTNSKYRRSDFYPNNYKVDIRAAYYLRPNRSLWMVYPPDDDIERNGTRNLRAGIGSRGKKGILTQEYYRV